MDTTFSVEEAQALVQHVRSVARELVPVRAELARRAERLRAGDDAEIPEVKALEAHLSELLDGLTGRGIQVKGYAPLLVDFPHRRGDRLVLLCWLEGETELGWFHELAHGFPGRRPLRELE